MLAGLTVSQALFLALFGAVGLGATGYGGRALLTAYRLRRASPTAVATLANVAGRVEVVGTARPADGTVAAPFTGDESLVCAWRVDEERPDGDGGSDWDTIAAGVEHVPFLVDDGSASVLVDAGAADHAFGDDHRIDVAGSEPPPDRVRAFLAATDEVDTGDSTLDLGFVELSGRADRRYRESRLDPGEDVVVYGEPTYVQGLADRSRQVNARFDGDFLLTDADEAGTERRVLARGVVALAIGLAFLGFVAVLLRDGLAGTLVVS